MTLNEKINIFFKKKLNYLTFLDVKTLRINRLNPIILIFFLIVFSILFFISSSLINKKNIDDANNFKEITNNNEFLNLTNFLFSKINSPYEEIEYVVKLTI